MAENRVIARREFLNLVALVGAELAAGCLETRPSASGLGGAGASGAAGAGGNSIDAGADGSAGAAGAPSDSGADAGAAKKFRAGISSFTDTQSRRTAVRRAIELAGGLSFIKPGDRVAIKVAHNSPFAYPTTASPESCGEIAKLCLDAGAAKVVVVDLMGIENTLVPGGWALEDKYGLGFDAELDATIRAFKASGIWDGVVSAVGAGNVGAGKPVQITSFREHGWRRLETEALTPGGAANARLSASWVKEQCAKAVDPTGIAKPRLYVPRTFDLLNDDVPGMYFPRLLDEVDHIINLARVSTHVMSHFTTALKNWVGIMRPDDRLWMHQLTFLLNHRGAGSDPIRSEPPYNEMLAELHLQTWQRERLVFADASEVIVSGGPDESPDPWFPAGLMLAATDLITADVVNLAVLRLGVLASTLEQGLGGKCEPQPSTMVETMLEFAKWRLGLREDGLMRGTDAKLCNPGFSHWDWIVVQRARELGMGPALPHEVALSFADDGAHAVPSAQQKWLLEDALRPPLS